MSELYLSGQKSSTVNAADDPTRRLTRIIIASLLFLREKPVRLYLLK